MMIPYRMGRTELANSVMNTKRERTSFNIVVWNTCSSHIYIEHGLCRLQFHFNVINPIRYNSTLSNGRQDPTKLIANLYASVNLNLGLIVKHIVALIVRNQSNWKMAFIGWKTFCMCDKCMKCFTKCFTVHDQCEWQCIFVQWNGETHQYVDFGSLFIRARFIRSLLYSLRCALVVLWSMFFVSVSMLYVSSLVWEQGKRKEWKRGTKKDRIQLESFNDGSVVRRGS